MMRVFTRGIVVVGCLALFLCLGHTLAMMARAESKCCSECYDGRCEDCKLFAVIIGEDFYVQLGSNNATDCCTDGPPCTEFICDEERRECWSAQGRIALYDTQACAVQAGNIDDPKISVDQCEAYDQEENPQDDSCD